MTYLRYAPDIEKPAPDEQETIDSIIAGMTQQSQTVEKREHHAVRASHAMSSACVTGELTVAAGLPPELAQGLFATPGTHPVAVRFAQGPGETLGDRVSTHRGMSIKVFDVPGEKLPGHAVDTQDFVLATGTTFPSGTAAGFLRDGTVIGKSTGLPEGVKSAVSSTMRNLNKVLPEGVSPATGWLAVGVAATVDLCRDLEKAMVSGRDGIADTIAHSVRRTMMVLPRQRPRRVCLSGWCCVAGRGETDRDRPLRPARSPFAYRRRAAVT